MINFRVPQELGIGLSRGAVCRLVSKGKTLDYSGTVINLASRLMNLARPSGVVFDADFGIELLPEKIRNIFAKERVSLLGIAEREPVEIYYSRQYGTRIPLMYKKRFDIREWKTDKRGPLRLEQIKLAGSEAVEVRQPLSSEPLDPEQISVKIYPPKPIAEKRGAARFYFRDFRYSFEKGEHLAYLDYVKLAKTLQKIGLKDKDQVTIEIRYPI